MLIFCSKSRFGLIDLFGIALCLCLTGQRSFAAEVLKATKKAVVLSFDTFEENFVVGDRLITSAEGKNVLIEITKIKGARMLGRILSGQAEPGMKLLRRDVVDDKPPSTSTANLETVTIRLANNYVWRGISYNRTMILGSVDLNSGGLLAGLVILNQGIPATAEADVYLAYMFTGINWSLIPSVAQYSFTSAGYIDTTDFGLKLGYRVFTLEYSYIPHFYGSRSRGDYYGLLAMPGLGPRWKALFYAGYSVFWNPAAVGYKNYLNYKVGAVYSMPEFSVEFAWTDANRRDLENKPFPDGTSTVVISKTF